MKILLVYINKDENLERCLDSLKKYSPQIPVILKQADPKVTKIAEEVYVQYLEEIDDDVMFWHSDMVATPLWYEKLLEYYDEFDVMGVKLIYPNGLVQHYGGVIRFDGVGFHPHQFSLDIGLTKPLDTAFITGTGMIIKKKVWKAIKWDKSFTSYPDVDFCFQARDNGFSVGVIPVTLIHEEAVERDKSNENARLKDGHDRFVAKWMHVLNHKS